MQVLHFAIEENPSDETLRRISQRLRAYNEAQVGPYPAKKFAIVAWADKDTFVGGIYGWLQWGWLYIDWAYVEAAHRRTGVGSALLAKFEALAQEHGVARARLNTASFQGGLAFYQRHGYQIFAQLEITAPDGTEHTDYFLRKTLQA